MKCIDCFDIFGIRRKCCGSTKFTEQEKDIVVSQGFAENEFFHLTNDGWYSNSKLVATGVQLPGDDQTYDVYRCVFLADDGNCNINDFKPEASCKNYPRTDVESQDCGDGGYEGSGY